MAMSVGPSEGEDEVVSAINTTPLVDVMLVLLIIFLITIPVVTHTRLDPKLLPKDRNQPTQTKPDNIVIEIDKDGDYFWNQTPVPDAAGLLDKLKKIATKQPQPEVHIRADENGRYEFVGRVVVALQRAGIYNVQFITQPPPKGGTG